ncbi:hypothetical protein MTO96_009025 [Rhipicephalus appendiculatus]
MRSRQGVSDAGRALYVAWEACRRLVNASTPSPRKSSRLAKVKTMIRGIVHEFVASIDGTRWLPVSIREELKNRVRHVRWMLGYAPRLDQWAGLDRFYMGYPTPTGVFAADYLAARQERMRRFLESLHDDNNVHTRFAYVEQPRSKPRYVASQNRVVLPAASMLPPMFDTRSLPEVNYGLLGSLLLRVMARVAIDEANIKHEKAEASRLDRPHCQTVRRKVDVQTNVCGPHQRCAQAAERIRRWTRPASGVPKRRRP